MPIKIHLTPPRAPSTTGPEADLEARNQQIYHDSFTRMAQIARSNLDIPEAAEDDKPNFEEVKMCYRLILRNEGTLPVETLVGLQQLIKNDNKRINHILQVFISGDPTTEFNSLISCAMRALFEE